MFKPASSISIRLAVWSGPRNISTAAMRSWGNRDDTAVVDEPFYAHYLAHTGIVHPGREEVLAAQENDWEKVKQSLLGPIADGKTIFYQKHMAHHLLPHMQGDWIYQVQHVFLLRPPDAMLLSLDKILTKPELADTGLPQQLALFEQIKQHVGQTPLVIDSVDLLRNPEGMLRAWCASLGIEFDSKMLNWPTGPRATDGVWAKYWYGNVEKSSGFQPHREKSIQLPETIQDLYSECLPFYQTMYAQRLQV